LADAQNLGSARGRAVNRIECSKNRDAFELGHRDARNKCHHSAILHVTMGGRRQVVALDDVAFAHHHRALDRVFELSHVPRPRIDQQVLKRIVAEPLHISIVFFRILAQECVRQDRDIASSHAQRRHVELNDLEPVVEILAEPAFVDELLEVAIGRGYHTHVDFQSFIPADAFKLAFLQEAKQLDLNAWRNFADLVEEERAPISLFESAFTACHCAGERTPLVSEKLGLEQSLAE
jgi:hypothetical protein